MDRNKTFKNIEPAILYFGTPVALISTVDENNQANIGPVSSVWALGRTLVIGLECGSKTYQNLIKQGECVVNIPAASLFDKVERIATLTGVQPIPDYKKTRYQYEPDKSGRADLRNWRLRWLFLHVLRNAVCTLRRY
jgi:flavin reductase (DIM6/NTAB) family NADH-FMN oxidoreductase RutF